jgi:peroxiredoxin
MTSTEGAGALRTMPFWLLVLALLWSCGAPDQPDRRSAPAFKLPKLVGTDSLSSADLRGEYVLMNFWASWCGPCAIEVPDLAKIHRRFAGRGLTVLGVTVNDRPEDSRGFAREYGIPYVNVIGTDDLFDGYRLSQWLPTTLLIGPDGAILKEWLGPQKEATFLAGIRDVAPELRDLALSAPTD